MEGLSNHVIVCGYGRNGKQVCKGLIDENEVFVVIDPQTEVPQFPHPKAYYLTGDATEDTILLQAGVAKHVRSLQLYRKMPIMFLFA